MGSKFLHRALLALMTIMVGGLISATLARYAPGFGTDENQLDARLSSASIAAIRDLHPEERNVATYYANSLRRALHGDLGTSRSLNRPVRRLIFERSAVTLKVAGEGLALAWFATGLAVLATWLLRSSTLAGSINFLGGTLLCLPAAVMALLSIMLNAPGYLAIALIIFPKVHRYLGNLVSDARQMPHILTAQSKGISELRLLCWHVMPVLKRETLALAGVSVGLALSAAIPVEALCGIPGLGQLAWQSAMARDLPLLINLSLLVVACVTLANSGADLLADEGRAVA
jgi:peptide/nickel transport system permease protein